ncbi:H(+)-transporting two-sector ATPase [Sphaerochaeta globosa str. Buddy]|uniref:H(+)-transporting two-sector ATPase n=2 Tax=Sphaerochaeta TaxID=399320 RepID=F0RRX3_SPHGB|nr:H(+)-transporting two-sector ATPase [Sphaerochaeta globosa str. Buddy]
MHINILRSRLCFIMKKPLSKRMQPNHLLLVGFLLIILFGSLLLSLPIAHNPGIDLAYIDALFISASAVCVTGLVTVDVALTFSLFGRTVIAVLILLGGLGFAAIVISFSLLLGMNVNLSKRLFIKEAYNLSSMKGTLGIVRAVLISSFLIQGVGTVVEYFVFRQAYSPLDAFGHALFNTISAFNNAGFDLMGGYRSLTVYQDNLVMNLTTALLIILGGSGFFVLADCVRNRKWSTLSMHSRIVILMNASLITLGLLFFMAVEHLSPLAAFFQSVTTRTAGFNTVDIAAFSQAGLFFAMILMFIGASPGSTGGGIKTTTTFALLLSLGSLMFRREPAAFKRKVNSDSILKAFQVLLLSFLVVVLGSMTLVLIEGGNFDFLAVLFETVSAFATVGLSCGITPSLSTVSKVVLSLIMFAGRVGPITIATSLKAKPSHLGYIEEQVFIG